MKKLSALLAIILTLSLTGCAVAGQPKPTKTPEKTSNITADELVDNIRAKIAWYNEAIAKAKEKLNATKEWQKYDEIRKRYNEAAEEFNKSDVAKEFWAADKKLSELKELRIVKGLQLQQDEWKKALGEGGK